MAWTDVSDTVKIMALLGRLRPQAYDVFPPHSHAVAHRGDLAALNPQPLPPAEAFAAGAVRMARRLTELAVEADVRGERSGWLGEVVDDWCGTPWPRKWPLPGPWPPLDLGPQPEPWVVAAGRVAGATVFALAASQLGDGELRDVLAQGAQRLAEVAVREG